MHLLTTISKYIPKKFKTARLVSWSPHFILL